MTSPSLWRMSSTHENVIERIVEARATGEVIAQTRNSAPASVESCAAMFGLREDASIYRRISADEAQAVLAAVIHEDMAYGIEIVARERAEQLAAQFIAQVSPQTTRFYTNGNFGRDRPSENIAHSWLPATDATFDTGVLALGASFSACVWFKDED